MLEAKRKLEEAQFQQLIREQKREKEEQAKAKWEMLAKLKADKKARGGHVSDDEEEVKQKKEQGFDKV